MASVQSVHPSGSQGIPVHNTHSETAAQKRKQGDVPSPTSSTPGMSRSLAEDDESPQSVEGMAMSESKRRAQNRAAQRAFRERKERHLKELESRLAELESESRSWKSTNMALRSQLTLLEEELQHYRLPGQTMQSDMQNSANALPAHMLGFGAQGQPNQANQQQPQHQIPQQPQQQPQQQQQQLVSQQFPALLQGQSRQPPQQQSQQRYQLPTPSRHYAASPYHHSHTHSSQTQPSPGSIPGLSYESPGSGSGSSVPSRADEFCDKLSMACGTRDRPVPESAPTIASESAGWQQDSLFGVRNLGRNNSTTADWVQNDAWNDKDLLFDLPTQTPQNSNNNVAANTNNTTSSTHTPSGLNNPTSQTVSTPSSSIRTSSTKPYEQQSTANTNINDSSVDFMQNPLNLDFGNIATGFGPFKLNGMGENNDTDNQSFPTDINGLLNNDFGVFDPLDDMLVWDPQSNQPQSNQPQSSQSQSNQPQPKQEPQLTSTDLAPPPPEGLVKKELSDEQVPIASQNFIPCADVWDRICSHPKFGEIDINSMCQELRNKARCSKTGVVLDEQDVDAVLGTLR